MGANNVVIVLPIHTPAKIIKWKVSEGNVVSVGRVILLYDSNAGEGKTEPKKLKATQVGTVVKLYAAEGETVNPGEPLFELGKCYHPTVMKDMCAECGADLRMDNYDIRHASVPMVHSVPELKVSVEQAQILGQADEDRLLKQRKLILMVDLDHTLIHTTNDDILPNLKDVHHFQLDGGSPWYHTRLRPGTHKFLENMSRLYELHICTFGSRRYAHAIAAILDCSKKFFSHRILSRDECFNPNTKTANLKALFPLGDNLVCIIDDREDVWNHAPNLVHVRPYHFFLHTGDINAPPCMSDNYGYSPEECNVNLINRHAILLGESNDTNSKKEEAVEDEEANAFLGHEDCLEELDINAKQDASAVKASENACDDADDKPKVEEKGAQENCHFKDEGGGQGTVKKTDCKSEEESDCAESEGGQKEVLQSSTEQSEKVNPKSVKEEEVQKKETQEDVLLELDDHDDYLLHLEDILGTIHRAFYQIYDQSPDIPDMKSVVPYVRRKVLQGLHLCFSGVVPIGVPLEASRVYAVARSLGAEVSNELVLDEEIYCSVDGENSRGENSTEDEVKYSKKNKEQNAKSSCKDEIDSKTKLSKSVNNEPEKSKKTTTHLVAARLGTYKVNQAKRIKGTSLHIVTPDWLWCCAERWEKVDERLFPLNRSTSADNTKKFKNIFGEVQPRQRDMDDSVKAGVSSPNAQDESSTQEVNSSATSTVAVSCNNNTPSIAVSAFATYDPVTGKRVRKEATATAVNDGKANVAVVEERKRTRSGRFMDTINPLLSFSSEDLANMEDEVEEGLFDEEEDETESDIEGLKQEEEGLDFDFQQSKKIEDGEMGFLGNGGKNNRKRKSSYISSSGDKERVEEGDITKHFTTEDQLKEWDYDESVEMDDAEEDDDDDQDWSMMGAALEREIMADEIE
ncbi:RNA polymerase II subunit A C-terminal domain phosphatase [Hetaerina americana]|uniref:RNA polymerase II subunit A C-terminal domain phosphatase n=1 Tax=Hetaerina americana TaxID=62018 RepID=UPI003A7F2563